MQEDVTRDGDEIIVNVDVNVDEFVRKRRCDLGEGQKIVAKGERIRATTLALLASQGFAEVQRPHRAEFMTAITTNTLFVVYMSILAFALDNRN